MMRQITCKQINYRQISFLLTTALLVLCISTLATQAVWAQNRPQTEVYTFETPEQEALFHRLTRELRCPKCQNQSISDSNAPLAADMRDKTYQMVMQGADYDQVIDYMKTRFGDFVHYRPPLNMTTVILWVGPLLVLFIGLMVIVMQTRKRGQTQLELTAAEQEQLEQLLNKEDN